METEQKKVTHIYAMLCVAMLMSFAPFMTAAGLALLMFLTAWTAAYVLRARAEQGSIMEDHMTFVIRTLWIAGLLALFTMAAAIFYVLGVYDPSVVEPCANGIMAATDPAAAQAALEPCIGEFMRVNGRYLINGAIIGAGPVVVYMIYRLAKGLSRAIRGHRIGDVKSWF